MLQQLILTALFIASPSQHPGFTVYAEDSGNAQFVDSRGNIGGSSVEIFRELQKRVGDSSAIQVVPWARGYTAGLTAPRTILFSVTRTPDREESFRWVGPVIRVEWILYACAKSSIIVRTLDEAKKIRIGTITADAREEYLRKMGFRNIDTAPDNITNVRKCAQGRIDAFVSTNIGFGPTIKRAGSAEKDFRKLLVISDAELYIAFSKDVPAQEVARWQAAFESMKKDGTFARIYQEWYPGETVP